MIDRIKNNAFKNNIDNEYFLSSSTFESVWTESSGRSTTSVVVEEDRTRSCSSTG